MVEKSERQTPRSHVKLHVGLRRNVEFHVHANVELNSTCERTVDVRTWSFMFARGFTFARQPCLRAHVEI